MVENDQKPERDAPRDDRKFRAVVKRLLDTPPMHKTKDTEKSPKRVPSKKEARAD